MKATSKQFFQQERKVSLAETGDPELGPLQLLPGKWQSLPGRGWNMIALPFAGDLGYRLLVNQYDEELTFGLVDKAVPNRGIGTTNGQTDETDQFIVTLDYTQVVTQIAADDFPQSGDAGNPGAVIHHEPGLWLHMKNETTNGLDIARLASIPHGNAALGLGKSVEIDGAPTIPEINGLPLGVSHDLNSPYLAPYKHFHDNLFQNLFDPTQPNALLNEALEGLNVKRTTVLEVDTTVQDAGVRNIPFVVKQADADSMKSTFWVMEVENADGKTELMLQYSQVVSIDFFERKDGVAGKIRWPHVSINTLKKV